MKTNLKRTILATTAFLAILLCASVSQANQLSIVGAGALQKDSYSNATAGTTYDAQAKMGYGAGFLIDHNFDRGFGFQFGALYLTQKQDETTSTGGVSAVTDYSQHVVQVPVTLQFRLMPGLTMGLGGYYSHLIGDITATDSSGNVTQESASDRQVKSYDMGGMGGIALHIPLTHAVHFLADARYTVSFVNQDTSGAVTKKPQGFEFLVGLTFGMKGSSRY